MQGAEPVPCSASPRTPWWIFSGQWEFSCPSRLGSQVSLFPKLAKRSTVCGKPRMASWEFCVPLLLIIKLAAFPGGTARYVCWVSGGAGWCELKVVQVQQTSAGLHSPAAQAGRMALANGFLCRTARVFRLLGLVWQVGEALLLTEEMLCKKALIHD